MFLNYLLLAFRSITRCPVLTGVKVVGFVVGVGCALCVFIYAHYESNYDARFTKSGQIYQFNAWHKSGSNVTLHVASDLFDRYKSDLPAIEALSSQASFSNSVAVDSGTFDEHVWSVDSQFFQLINAQFLAGNRSSALKNPGSVVISHSAAEQYFGDAGPLNRFVTINNKPHVVTAVIDDFSVNSRFYGWSIFVLHPVNSKSRIHSVNIRLNQSYTVAQAEQQIFQLLQDTPSGRPS